MDNRVEQIIDAIDIRRQSSSPFKLYKNEENAIVASFKKEFPKSSVLRASARDQESPYGTVITWLRDYYHLPKSIGGSVADKILADYQLN